MNVDKAVFLFLNELTGIYYLDVFFYFLARILPYIVVIFLIFFLLRSIKNNTWLVGEALLAGIFARYGLVEVLRRVFPRERPFQALEDVNLLLPYKESVSFPSGHMAFLFAIATVAYFYKKSVGISLFVLFFLSAVARIYVGMHWPADVFAGALVGVFAGIVISEISNFLKKSLTKK
jgi:undecaprenyl-diphosphatase